MRCFVVTARLAALLCLAGCGESEDSAIEEESFSYPLDDVLRLSDAQSVGTHNSYHMRTGEVTIKEWDYEHAPLDVQLGAQGVRQFELDVWLGASGFEVYHIPDLDDTSTCFMLADCLSVMRAWSDKNPAHLPFLTLLEVKDDFDAATAAELLDTLDSEVNAAWPAGRRISPDDIQGDATNLAEAVATVGWPTLGELRGRAIFVLHTDGDYRGVYTDADTTTLGRALFPDAHGDISLAIAATSSINTPTDPAISAALLAGHLVRTRTDSDGTEARANDTTDLDAALASGAHFLSTDFPVPHPDTGYAVTMPGGTPARCNPVTAPVECTALALEDPRFIE